MNIYFCVRKRDEVIMVYGEQQKREIETIKERYIKLKLSDADCERVYNLCGMHNISFEELLENFIGDLVDGTYSNGSDERMYAEQWFERCWFGSYPETTLLSFLLDSGYDIYDNFLEVLDDIDTGYGELELYKKDPTVFDEEEIEFLRDDIVDWESHIEDIKSDFLKNKKDADWNQEVEKVLTWWKEKQRCVQDGNKFDATGKKQ